MPHYFPVAAEQQHEPRRNTYLNVLDGVDELTVLIMKLDTKAMRYLTAEDWKVLTGVWQPHHCHLIARNIC